MAAQIEKIDLLDTEYVEIMANSKNAPLELYFIRTGLSLEEARAETNSMQVIEKKPETDE